MEQKNENTITIDTTNLENYRVGLEDKLYGIDNTIKTKLLEQLDKVLNGLKCYNGKEIKKEEDVGKNEIRYFNLMNLSNTTQEQQEVYFEEDEKPSKSKTSSNSSFSSSDNYEESLKTISSLSSLSSSSSEDKESSKSTTSSSSLSFTLSDDDKKYLKSNNSLSKYYTFATKEIEEVIVTQTNSRSGSPTSGL